MPMNARHHGCVVIVTDTGGVVVELALAVMALHKERYEIYHLIPGLMRI